MIKYIQNILVILYINLVQLCRFQLNILFQQYILLIVNGCREVVWKFPEEIGFYQPIVVTKK